jgi:hypothetical protein
MRLLTISAVFLALACAVSLAQPAATPKPYVIPDQVPALPTKASILFLKGPGAENWQVEAAAKLLGAGVKVSNVVANATGDRLDYLPASMEELFHYNLVVIGNVDYPAIGEVFTAGLKYFVGHGGALQVLGGDHAFGQGGYAGTPLENLLPIKCGDKTDLKPAMPDGVITFLKYTLDRMGYGTPSVVTPLDPAKPSTALVHVPAALKPDAIIKLRAGDGPFMVVSGSGRVEIMLGATQGTPAAGVPFWKWDGWPKTLSEYMGEFCPAGPA